MRLYLEEVPITTANIVAYVNEGFYDGGDGGGATVIHRIEPDFVIQGGGELADGTRKPTYPPIVNEASGSGLGNLRGTVAMARTSEPDSATSQWFVNLKDNPALDPDPSQGLDGYAVFGVVVSSMDVVDTLASVPTDGSRPLDVIPITDARVIPAPQSSTGTTHSD